MTLRRYSVLLIAATHAQARDELAHASEVLERRFRLRYVGSSSILRGVSPEVARYVLLGTWYERRDIDEILAVLRARGVKETTLAELLTECVEKRNVTKKQLKELGLD